jgi:glyoxalase superfamily protein
MSLTVGMYHFDCSNPTALAQFWAGVLEIPVDPGASEQLATIDIAKKFGPTWIFQKASDLPDGRNRFAVDLSSDDWLQQAQRVQALGGTRLDDHDVDGVRWVDLLDIEANLLRIFAPRQTDN